MIKKYKAINDRLDDVNFARIVEGFERCSFAIFDDEKAIIDGETVKKPNQFVANSVAKYNDSFVATFYHEFLPKDINIATSLIVHEMFHVFQFGKMNYNSLLKNNREINGVFYEYTADSITLKYNEVACLVDAYLNGSEDDYRRFLSFRRLRKARYPKEIMYEDATEFIEGFATYVEMKTLEQLNESLFEEKTSEFIELLMNVESYFSIREFSYKVGALMLLTLDKLKISYDNVIKGNNFISDAYFFEYREPLVKSRADIQSLVDKKAMDSKASIDQFFSGNYIKIDFDEVVGFNPMGTIRSGNKLLVKFLVIIKVEGVERNLNGEFCFICDENKDVVELYKSIDV